MPPTRSYYRILQVDPSAEPEVITAAYRRLALKYHPDSNQAPDALRRMQEINEAYEVLSDPVQRQRYNLQLAAQAQRAQSRPTGDQPFERGRQRENSVPTPVVQAADRQLGCTFLVVYGVIALVLLRLAVTRLTSPWMILLVLVLAGVLTFPVVFRIDDYLRKR